MNQRNARRVPPRPVSSDLRRNRAEPDKARVEDLQTMLRVLVGGVLEGTDELMRRLKAAQAELEPSAATTTVDPNETDLDRLRYALISTLIQTPELMREGLTSAGRVSNKATGFVSKVVGPVASSRLMKPVRQRTDRLIARGQARVDRLLERGRAEEQVGRVLARRATANGVDELLDYLAQKPEIRDLVQQQSMGMADEMMGEIQNRSAAADALAERIARAILRRPQRETLPAEADPRQEAK
jgi:hypothetical protein